MYREACTKLYFGTYNWAARKASTNAFALLVLFYMEWRMGFIRNIKDVKNFAILV